VAINKLNTELSAIRKTYIMTLPGNHDVALTGWSFRGLFRKDKIFNEKLPFLQFPSHDDSNDVYLDIVKEIFAEFSVAIFPFNSNARDKKVFFAQGHIENPEKVFAKYKQAMVKIARENNISFDSCVKIAGLHHHLLPLPGTEKDKKAEPGMILHNAYEFIDAAQKNKVDLIIHGHKHVSGLVEYKSHRRDGYTQYISSCASSSKRDAPIKEIKTIEISQFGGITIESYSANENEITFVKDKNNCVQLVGYGDRRKIKYKDRNLLPHGFGDAVNLIDSKTKTVAIKEDGNASIAITMENIQWLGNKKLKIVEQLQADIGRISYGWTYLSTTDRADFTKKGKFWPHPQGDTYVKARPCEPESHKNVCVADNMITADTPSYYKTSYHLFNGFMLTQEDHKECYGKWDRNREEECSIQANYPTKLLELVISFPDKQFFPKRNEILLDAALRLPEDKENSLALMKMEYDKEGDESSFLERKSAIRYRPDLLELAVVIKHPQPHLLYILRWNLPNRKNHEFKLSRIQLPSATPVS